MPAPEGRPEERGCFSMRCKMERRGDTPGNGARTPARPSRSEGRTSLCALAEGRNRYDIILSWVGSESLAGQPAIHVFLPGGAGDAGGARGRGRILALENGQHCSETLAKYCFICIILFY